MDIEQELKERFRGYHVEIQFYPSGGYIECIGCEECKTDYSRIELVMWKTDLGHTLESAIDKLERKMAKRYGDDWRASKE